MNIKKTLLSILALGAFLSANAEIIMPKVFSDYMVLQREMPVKIWGKADANARVKVDFAAQSKETTACENGNWSLLLEPMQANASNQSMQISENGKVSKEIKDILVGEVWVAGGQSNMAMTVKTIKDFSSNKKMQNLPLLRYFTQQMDAYSNEVQSDSDKSAKWSAFNKNSATQFSATGFFFAYNLIAKLNMPVAIIHTPVGASRMVAWLDRADFAGIDCLEKSLVGFDEALANYDYDKAVAENNKKIAALAKGNKAQQIEAKKLKKKAPRKGAPFDYRHCPSLLYNAKLAPLAGYTARGFIWYQGESDIGISDEDTPPVIDFYAVFERLIASWRKYWGNDSMPFYFVQLPSFELKKDWALFRWNQFKIAKNVDNVHMAVLIDTGDATNIHPKDKQIVGARLASLALENTYNLDIKATPPLFDKALYDSNKVEVFFDTKGEKLELKGEARGFEVLISDSWQKATFDSLSENSLSFSFKNGEEIKGIRYLWKSWAKPYVCLYNKNNLPAMGFVDRK